jgi:hypothetical protein
MAAIIDRSRMMSSLFSLFWPVGGALPPCRRDRCKRMRAAEIPDSEKQWRLAMKTIITVVAAAMLAIGAGSAMADQQRSDEAADYALSQRVAQGFDGAYASANVPSDVRGRPVEAPYTYVAPYTVDLSGIPAAR